MLVEVNVAGEEGKGGVAPAELGEFIERCPVRVVRPDDDAAVQPGPGGLAAPFRPPRRARRRARALPRLSMGTSQDWQVAVEEGATIVRLGTALYRVKRRYPGHNP